MYQLAQLDGIEPIAPGATMVQFNDLKVGDQFQYMGSEPEDWNTVNGVNSWDSNPWVWVISFKVLSKTGYKDIYPGIRLQLEGKEPKS